LNIGLFFAEEWVASSHRFGDGVAMSDIIEGFAATIDTATWVVLLLMFELETSVLDDRHVTRRVLWLLQGLRSLCYIVIVYAFYGYLSKLVFLLAAVPMPALSDLCSLAGTNWAYAVDLDKYVPINTTNCASLSSATSFMQYGDIAAVSDREGYVEILRLGWVDVINAGVWIGVVVMLELDVYLHAKGRLVGLAKTASNTSKYVMYSVLFLAAVYWGVKGAFIDFWDAFLWLLAFAFIEMNVFEWQKELQRAPPPRGSARNPA
jgi:hypothetical protein